MSEWLSAPPTMSLLTLVLAVATVVLAFATIWLALATHLMAIAASKQITLISEPHIAIKGIDLKTTRASNIVNSGVTDAIRFGLVLSNPGAVITTYRVVRFPVPFTNIDVPHEVFSTKGGVVHPHSEMMFLTPFLAPVNESIDTTLSTPIDLEVSIEYWAPGSKIYRLDARIKIKVLSTSPLDYVWNFTDGPNYSN